MVDYKNSGVNSENSEKRHQSHQIVREEELYGRGGPRVHGGSGQKKGRQGGRSLGTRHRRLPERRGRPVIPVLRAGTTDR